MENYNHLVMLGCGSIGGSLLKVCRDDLAGFKRITVIDREERALPGYGNLRFLLGDLNRPEVLNSVLSSSPDSAFLVLNLTEDVDNLAIRQIVSGYRAAYLDAAADIIADSPDETRFSRLTPYNQSVVRSEYPQWTCWGINPGLVEIAARLTLKEFDRPEDRYSINIFEYDQLTGKIRSGKTAVGWSPRALVTEITQTPTLEIVDGKTVEHKAPQAKNTLMSWDGQTITGRKVAHEEVWNFGQFLKAWNSFFVYALHPRVMEILKRPPGEAISELEVPNGGESICGTDRIAVQVTNLDRETEKCLVWEEDHGEVHQRYGVNAIQLQTCRGIRLAIRLLQSTRLGRLPGTFCASNLPLQETDWKEVREIMEQLEINWRMPEKTGPAIIDG